MVVSERGGTCGVYGEKRNAYRNLKKSDHL
jgi:hypothetical protein